MGGDPIYGPATRISEKLCESWLSAGRGVRCSISTTGFSQDFKLQVIRRLWGAFPGSLSVELTIDTVPGSYDAYRGNEYNMLNANLAERLFQHGISPIVVTVLRRDNIGSILRLASYLSSISGGAPFEWDFILYYPVGRGSVLDLLPSRDEVVFFLEDSVPRIRGILPRAQINIHRSVYQYVGITLKRCEIPHQIGILPDGSVVLCPWGISKNGKPFPWNYLGNVYYTPLNQILANRAYFLSALSISADFYSCITRRYVKNVVAHG